MELNGARDQNKRQGAVTQPRLRPCSMACPQAFWHYIRDSEIVTLSLDVAFRHSLRGYLEKGYQIIRQESRREAAT